MQTFGVHLQKIHMIAKQLNVFLYLHFLAMMLPYHETILLPFS